MRLLTPGDSAPASVTKYLLPNEERVITVRRHPAILLLPGTEVLSGLIVAGVLTNTLAAGNQLLINLIWWLWLVLLVRFTWKVVDWALEYLVVTKTRILFTSGVVTRRVDMMPLSKVTDMSFQRTVMGRMLGYGEFIIESAGQDQALRTIHYIPYAESLYLEVMEMIFPANKSGESKDGDD